MSYFADKTVTMVEQVTTRDGVQCDSCGLKVVVANSPSPSSAYVQSELVGWGRWAVVEPSGNASRSAKGGKDLCPSCVRSVDVYIRDMKLARER